MTPRYIGAPRLRPNGRVRTGLDVTVEHYRVTYPRVRAPAMLFEYTVRKKEGKATFAGFAQQTHRFCFLRMKKTTNVVLAGFIIGGPGRIEPATRFRKPPLYPLSYGATQFCIIPPQRLDNHLRSPLFSPQIPEPVRGHPLMRDRLLSWWRPHGNCGTSRCPSKSSSAKIRYSR